MTESRNDGQAENSIPPLKLRFAGGIIMKIDGISSVLEVF